MTPAAVTKRLLKPYNQNASPASRAVPPSLSVSFSADALLAAVALASRATSAEHVTPIRRMAIRLHYGSLE
jgi:hypothetical protein